MKITIDFSESPIKDTVNFEKNIKSFLDFYTGVSHPVPVDPTFMDRMDKIFSGPENASKPDYKILENTGIHSDYDMIQFARWCIINGVEAVDKQMIDIWHRELADDTGLI